MYAYKTHLSIDPNMQELTTPTTTGDDTSGTTVEISMIIIVDYMPQ
jgi:hypothetical protein